MTIFPIIRDFEWKIGKILSDFKGNCCNYRSCAWMSQFRTEAQWGKYNITPSWFLQKNQHFFLRINGFTKELAKELISRNFFTWKYFVVLFHTVWSKSWFREMLNIASSKNWFHEKSSKLHGNFLRKIILASSTSKSTTSTSLQPLQIANPWISPYVPGIVMANLIIIKDGFKKF